MGKIIYFCNSKNNFSHNQLAKQVYQLPGNQMDKFILVTKYAVIFLLFLVCGVKPQSAKPSITAVKAGTPPVIDGKGIDSVWHTVPGNSDFLQIDPQPGRAPAFETEVKVVYTDENLFFLFICYDPEPENIIAREMKYDGYTSGDDNVKLILDTFGDERNAYWLATNPLGVKNDAMLSGRSYQEFNEDWDMIWEVASSVADNHWCAEIRIPFASLKFPNAKEQLWGINFLRGIRRLNQDVIWSGAVANGNFLDLTRAGELRGIKDVERGNPVYVVPFVNTGIEDIRGTKDSRFKGGLDVKYGISDAFTLDFTLNTDFAQVEADIAEINLTRFPLFLPEKRDFFLEGNKLFSFDLASNNSAYYSRVIGIDRGEGVPIIGGVKLTGSTGRLEAGILSVQTEGTAQKRTTNYFVSRAKYGILDNSYAGFIFSNVQSADGFSRLGGADLSFNFNDFLGDKNLMITSKLAGTFDGSGNNENLAGVVSVEYPNEVLSLYSSYGFTQGNFNPGTGFIYRSGVNEFSFYASYAPRFDNGWLRRAIFMPVEFDLQHAPGGKIISYEYEMMPVSLLFESNDRISLLYTKQFDRPERDFTIFKNMVIRSGDYHSNLFGIDFTSSQSRLIFGSASMEYGDFYGGKRFEFESEVNATMSGNFGMTVGYRFNDISINGSRFNTNEIFSRLKFTLNVNTASFLLVQWNNEIEALNFNYKINYKPSPGSDIYLVINKILETGGGLRSKDLVVILKVSWMFIL